MDTAQVLDLLFTLTASGCLLFLVYGAWLCLRARSGVPDGAQQPVLSSRTGRVERSAIQA
jgi:hypothetical protein